MSGRADEMTPEQKWEALCAANDASALWSEALATAELVQVSLALEGYAFTNRPAGPTTFYVSTNGTDDNPGTSTNSPWQTLDRVNATKLIAGDRVLFKRGEEWRGQIVKTNLIGTAAQPIYFGVYGEGAPPVINGSVLLTGWQETNTAQGVSCYKLDLCANFTSSYFFSQLVVDDRQMPSAREPNNGFHQPDEAHIVFTITNVVTKAETNVYLGVTNVTINSVITNFINRIVIEETTFAAQTGWWTGATVVFNPKAWNAMQARRVLPTNGVHGGVIPLEGLFTNLWKDNFRYGHFFVTDDIDALDSHGEWYHDREANILYLCWTNGHPNSHVIEASVFGTGIMLYQSSNVVIEGIDLCNTASDGIAVYSEKYTYINTDDHVSIVSNTILRARRNGIFICYGNSYRIEGNEVWDACLNGIYVLYAYTNTVIAGNRICRTGLLLTQENSQDSVGIKQVTPLDPWWGATEVWLARNVVISSGYFGVMCGGERTCAAQNYIAWSGLLFGETQALGTGGWGWRGNAFALVSNTVVHNVGGQDGQIMYRLTSGICSDIEGTNIIVAGNTVIDCGAAIALNNKGATVRGNVLHRNLNTWFPDLNRALVYLSDRTSHAKVYDNMFVTGDTGEYAIAYDMDTNSVITQAAGCVPYTESNYYCNIWTEWPLSSQPVQMALRSNVVYTLDEWQGLCSNDLYSVECTIPLREHLQTPIATTVACNTSAVNSVYETAGLFYCDITCGVVKTAFALPPFRSRVLFHNGYPWPVNIPLSGLVIARKGEYIQRELPVTDGQPGYGWQIESGALPPGVALATNGVLQGTPASCGDYAFTARVEDSRTDTTMASYVCRVIDPGNAPAGGVVGHGHVGHGRIGE
jgi:hypothetical protein